MIWRILSFLFLVVLTAVPWFILHTQPETGVTSLPDSEVVQGLTAERDALTAKVSQLEAEMVASDRDLIQISNQHTEKAREIESLNRELASSRATFESTSEVLKSQIANFRQEIERIRARAEKAESENLELLRELARSEASQTVARAPAAPIPETLAPSVNFGPPTLGPTIPSPPVTTAGSSDFPVVLPENFQEPQPQPEKDRSSGWLFAD